MVDGRFSLRHNSEYARSAVRFPDCLPLTGQQDDLLGLIDQLVGSPDIHVGFALEQNDIVLVDNYAVTHSRRAQDYEQEDRTRHLLRLWIVLDEGRPPARTSTTAPGCSPPPTSEKDGLDRA